MKITKRPIQRSIKTNNKDKNGYLWTEIIEDDTDLEGEIWLEYKDKLFVSNKGRIWFKNIKHPYKTYGSKRKEDGYFTVSLNSKSLKVHNIVALVFIGEKPTEEHTIDHIDNNKSNNNVENLRWATKSEQAINRTNIRQIEVYNILDNNIIDRFNSQKDCCEKYSVHPSIISNALEFGISHFNRGRQLGSHKYLSVRYSDLSKEDKLKRELNILDHDIEVLKRDKNKRKNIEEKLPVHITKTKNTYVLNITFRGTKYRECSSNIADLIKKREMWINERKEDYKNIYSKE
jgi:hypothetical protein